MMTQEGPKPGPLITASRGDPSTSGRAWLRAADVRASARGPSRRAARATRPHGRTARTSEPLVTRTCSRRRRPTHCRRSALAEAAVPQHLRGGASRRAGLAGLTRHTPPVEHTHPPPGRAAMLSWPCTSSPSPPTPARNRPPRAEELHAAVGVADAHGARAVRLRCRRSRRRLPAAAPHHRAGAGDAPQGPRGAECQHRAAIPERSHVARIQPGRLPRGLQVRPELCRASRTDSPAGPEHAPHRRERRLEERKPPALRQERAVARALLDGVDDRRGRAPARRRQDEVPVRALPEEVQAEASAEEVLGASWPVASSSCR